MPPIDPMASWFAGDIALAQVQRLVRCSEKRPAEYLIGMGPMPTPFPPCIPFCIALAMVAPSWSVERRPVVHAVQKIGKC